jgi:alkylated DNA repair dioxygenase AlkB
MIARPDAVSLNGGREAGALGAQKREQASVAMNQNNVLPCDGLAYVIDDTKAEFEWPEITACLAETIPWRIETARLFGRDMSVPRMMAWFGDTDYMYSGIRHRAAPFPAVVERLRKRAEAISGRSYNAVLLNLYRNGSDSVGWHSDHEAGLGDLPTIASLSLGATRRFQFRHRRTKETITLELSEGLWLVMAGETQRFWVHQVPKTAAAVERRINLTFRCMIPVHQGHEYRV